VFSPKAYESIHASDAGNLKKTFHFHLRRDVSLLSTGYISNLFVIFLIQTSCFSDRKAYTPGLSIRPHPFPKDVTPTSAPSHNSGPPESPWRENTYATCHVFDSHTCKQRMLETHSPDRCRPCSGRWNRHISFLW